MPDDGDGAIMEEEREATSLPWTISSPDEMGYLSRSSPGLADARLSNAVRCPLPRDSIFRRTDTSMNTASPGKRSLITHEARHDGGELSAVTNPSA